MVFALTAGIERYPFCMLVQLPLYATYNKNTNNMENEHDSMQPYQSHEGEVSIWPS